MFSAPIFNMLSLCYFKLNTDLKWSANYYILFLFAFYTVNQLFFIFWDTGLYILRVCCISSPAYSGCLPKQWIN